MKIKKVLDEIEPTKSKPIVITAVPPMKVLQVRDVVKGMNALFTKALTAGFSGGMSAADMEKLNAWYDFVARVLIMAAQVDSKQARERVAQQRQKSADKKKRQGVAAENEDSTIWD